MEHRIILGGEQFLPFARSRIKALKAIGLNYASQQFEIDGVSVRVRIEPGQEYIHIIGNQQLDMDSGIADSTAYAGVEQFMPGTFYETDYARQYNASFVASAYPEWRVNPGKTNQMSGRITGGGGRFKGKVRYDASESRFFKRRQIPIAGTDPVQWEPDPADLDLLSRKVMTYLVPASMFTGRCRLYVQAMYGRPAFQDDTLDDLGNVTQPGSENIHPAPNGYQTITIKSYLKPGTTGARPDDVGIGTSTGVYLDPETGNHWMLSPYEGGMSIMPLMSSEAGEKLRVYLKASVTSLNDDDKEHLEAAILSECLPDPLNAVSFDMMPVPPLGMGYGWHWNWTGLAADIVRNVGYDQGHSAGDRYGMESTHYRISVVPDALPEKKPSSGPTRSFSATLNIIEGPTRWAVNRQAWCIVYPAFGSQILAKGTSPKSILFSCNGFFYVFYRRDELILCRVEVEKKDAVSESTSTPGFGGRTTAITTGYDGGESLVSETSEHYEAVFDIGGLRMPASTFGRGAEHEVTKVHAPKEFITENVLTVANIETFDMTYGNPSQTINFPLQPSTNADGVPIKIPYQYEISNVQLAASLSTSRRTESTFSQVAVAIPYYDAEAIYIGGKQIKTTSLLDRTETKVSSDAYLFRQRVDGVIYDSPRGTNYTNYGAILSYVADVDITSDEEEWAQAWLVSKAGNRPATFTDTLLLDFYNPNNDYISDIFNTHSGVRVDNPVVLSRNKSPSVGSGGHADINFPVLCGWV